MDDQPLALAPQARPYLCPGDSHPIDRATHLARLAAFYPACRSCEHRVDVAELTPPQARQWAEVCRRAAPGPRFTTEELAGATVNDAGPAVSGRLATALAVRLWRQRAPGALQPTVLVGADGNWTTAELVAAACGALVLAGCRTVEAGALTPAALAAMTHRAGADAALWIGNATGQPHAIAVRLWGAAARPWSSPCGLDAVRELYEQQPSRPKRRGGRLERAAAGDEYLAPLVPMFHGLRPLRLLIDTVSRPLVRYLRQLAAPAACEVLLASDSETVATPLAVALDAESTYLERRLAHLGRHVVARHAHFGLWIDGAGESCRLVDERGRSVRGERLCRLLARWVLAEKPAAGLVLEPATSAALRTELSALGAHIAVGGSTREAMWAAFDASGAVFGGGPSGTFWFAGPPAAPDALLTTCLLLNILSQSDRGLSEVLDAA